jgi:hypothetical protein
MSIKGQSIGYITLLIGYVITGVGIYYLSYAKGEFDCNPYGEYLNECRNIGTDTAPNFSRSRYIPNDSGEKDPDGSLKYVLQEDTSACPKRDCKVGDWSKDGEPYIDSTTNTKKQKWKRIVLTEYDEDRNPILQTSQYGGKACPSLNAVTAWDGYPTEPFRFLRRRRRIRTGIEGNANYGGGIAGIVFGSIFIVVGYAIIFTTKN